MGLPQTLGVTLLVVLTALTTLWLLSLWRRDVSIVDAFWGLGFVIVVCVAIGVNRPIGLRAQLVTLLVSLWGLRLSLHLGWRNWGHDEDFRYAKMRAHHGKRFWWVSLFSVFLLQGLILWFVSFPLQTVAGASVTSLGLLDVAGALLCVIGIMFETIGDWQLSRFRGDPDNAGRVLDRGLWRYTRHPNYFGDFCVWWGFYLFALAAGAAWTIASPLLMSVLLLKVSGVSLLEKDIVDRRPEYARYKTQTNAFFPGPRRRV